MTRLILGVLLWSIAHFTPALAANFKTKMVARFGEYPWKGALTLFMVAALYLIVSGWMSMTPEEPEVLAMVFTPPEWSVYAAGVLALIGFVLFLAPYPPNNFKRMMRHPQLIGVVCLGVGHLTAVGTMRGVVFFGGLTVWALLEMVLINRRDGEWMKPDKAPFRKDLSMVLFSVLVYMAFLYTHHLLLGGAPLT